MAVIGKELLEILEDPQTLKCIAATDRDGIPHISYKGTLHVEEDVIVFYDILQSSQINKNLVHAIWFEKKVAISILSKDRQSFHIVGVPFKCVTAGAYFEKTYERLRAEKGDVDLNAIWYIRPEQVRENTFSVRKAEEEQNYPVLKHIDRMIKPEFLEQ
ncbi:MAG: pyridoxamine 5'-phosphate oxidase family protein [Lachnospiraceae bacterium]|nr:pyridoxamine 5'-phosphate oxidase family protein [Lachnospiraceae bacterium]